MKFGVREICDVVLRAKGRQRVGTKTFYKDEPILYFDSLKTSTLESAVNTVYAQGGRGNSRLVAWEGEKTVTFTMEDALLSPESFSVLAGAGLFDATEKPVFVHTTQQTDKIFKTTDGQGVLIELALGKDDVGRPIAPATDENAKAYVMISKFGELESEPYIANYATQVPVTGSDLPKDGLVIKALKGYTPDLTKFENAAHDIDPDIIVLADFYVKKTQGAIQIDITPDKFGGNYYLEASTLFRDTNGIDMPAEFIIPNCNIQSNFTFTMGASGDPSTFTFTMDAFPDYTKFDPTKKVLASVQIITDDYDEDLMAKREATDADGFKNPAEGVAELSTTYDTINTAYVAILNKKQPGTGDTWKKAGCIVPNEIEAHDANLDKAIGATRVAYNQLTPSAKEYFSYNVDAHNANTANLEKWEAVNSAAQGKV